MLRAKVDALEAGDPHLIATANIGCYAYLRQEAGVPGSYTGSNCWDDRRGLDYLEALRI
jgi:hypothetical protein